MIAPAPALVFRRIQEILALREADKITDTETLRAILRAITKD